MKCHCNRSSIDQKDFCRCAELAAEFYAQASRPPKPQPTLEFFECECGRSHPMNYVCIQMSSMEDLRT